MPMASLWFRGRMPGPGARLWWLPLRSGCCRSRLACRVLAHGAACSTSTARLSARGERSTRKAQGAPGGHSRSKFTAWSMRAAVRSAAATRPRREEADAGAAGAICTPFALQLRSCGVFLTAPRASSSGPAGPRSGKPRGGAAVQSVRKRAEVAASVARASAASDFPCFGFAPAREARAVWPVGPFVAARSWKHTPPPGGGGRGDGPGRVPQ